MLDPLRFLEPYHGFIRDYRATLCDNFLRVCGVLSMPVEPVAETREVVARLYCELFPFVFNLGDEVSLGDEPQLLVARGIDLKGVLSKCYMLMAKDFVGHVFSRENDVRPVTALLQLGEMHIAMIERLFPAPDALSGEVAGEVMEALRRLAAKRGKVTLFNLYKGVPVSHAATVSIVEDGTAAFAPHPSQVIVLDLQRRTYIKIEGLAYTVRAAVVNVDVEHSVAVLGDFARVAFALDKRRFLRVQPRMPIQVTVQEEEGRELRGQLIDISVGGLGFFALQRDWLAPNVAVLLRLSLPIGSRGEERGITLHGQLLKVSGGESPFKVAVKTFCDRLTENLIDQYMAQRQSEVVSELQEHLLNSTYDRD